MAPEVAKRRATAALRVAVLVASGVLAAWWPAQTLRNGVWSEQWSAAAWADASFASRGADARPGERLGVLVPPLGSSAEEMAMWYSAQYALVPALVEPVMLRDCFGPDRTKCGFARSGRVMVPFPRPEWVSFAEERLGLKVIDSSGAVLLMAADRTDPR